jgi:hypothetical protein
LKKTTHPHKAQVVKQKLSSPEKNELKMTAKFAAKAP